MKIEDTVVFEGGIYSLVLKRTMNIFQSGGVSTMSLPWYLRRQNATFLQVIVWCL